MVSLPGLFHIHTLLRYAVMVERSECLFAAENFCRADYSALTNFKNSEIKRRF